MNPKQLKLNSKEKDRFLYWAFVATTLDEFRVFLDDLYENSEIDKEFLMTFKKGLA